MPLTGSQTQLGKHLIEESDDLARDVLPPSLLVVHDTGRGSEDDVAELTGGKQLDNPLLEIDKADVVAGGDNGALVQTRHLIVSIARGNAGLEIILTGR